LNVLGLAEAGSIKQPIVFGYAASEPRGERYFPKGISQCIRNRAGAFDHCTPRNQQKDRSGDDPSERRMAMR
jgi:hypothetical protein